MTREDAAAYIARHYEDYLDAANRAAEDGSPADRNLSGQIDNALVTLGFTRAEVATAVPHPEDEEAFLKLVEYQVLRQVVRDLASFIDVSGQGESYKLSQIRANARDDLTTVEAEVLAIFGTLNPGPNGGILTMDLNFETDGPADGVAGHGDEWDA